MLQGSKPWRYTGKEVNMDREDIKELVKRWWDIYEDATLDYGVGAHFAGAPVAAEVEPSAGLKAALSEAGRVKYISAPSAAWPRAGPVSKRGLISRGI